MIFSLSYLYSINSLCKVMNINRSGYYKWLDRRFSPSIREINRTSACDLFEEYHYKLLPQDKTEFLEREIEKQKNIKPKKLVAFAGDGINDTPSIIRADIGIAMGGIGSDIAVENADVIIMQDHPLKIYDAIQIGKIARFVAIFNIAFAIFVKVLVLVLSLFGYSNMIIAVLADTGLTIVLVINSLLILARRLKHK